jgi:hypothetical protein
MIFSFHKCREFTIELTYERGNDAGKISRFGEEGESFDD